MVREAYETLCAPSRATGDDRQDDGTPGRHAAGERSPDAPMTLGPAGRAYVREVLMDEDWTVEHAVAEARELFGDG